MKVDINKCTGCEICIPYCNVGAITMKGGMAEIDNSVCVECWICYRNNVCPEKAIVPTKLTTFGDIFKRVLSDPTVTSKGTGVPGRGTEEAKTNDITGRYTRDVYGICIDMGRPGVGCYMRDVEKVAMALAGAGIKFAGPEETPLSTVMTNLKTGKIRDDILDVHLLSVIIEGICGKDEIQGVLEALLSIEKEIDTVFSLGIVFATGEEHDEHLLEAMAVLGLERPVRGKVNVGLGRPLISVKEPVGTKEVD